MRARPWIWLPIAASLFACGSTRSDPGGAGGGGSGGEGGGVQCPEPAKPARAFTIRVRNDREATITVPQGCSDDAPVRLEVGGTPLGIGPESANACSFSCEPILEGTKPPSGCSDCGPGSFIQIEPGQTVGFDWDRRVWQGDSVTAACSGLELDHECAMPIAVEPAVYAASLLYCADGEPLGFCGTDQATVAFQIDSTADTVDVVIGP